MIHRLGIDDGHLRENKIIYSFQMQCCYTDTEGMSPLTKMKFRQIREEEREGFAVEQK